MELYIIQLPKLKRKLENLEGIENEKLVTWLRFIQNPNELEEKDMSDNEELKQAYKILDDVNSNAYERDMAERRLDWIRCENDARDHLEREGIKKGKAEGKAEEKIETAKRLLEMKLSIKDIMKATGLTEDEIKQLK